VGLTYALAVLVPNVTVIFGFTAATAGGIIAFLLPSLFMILLVDTSVRKQHFFFFFSSNSSLLLSHLIAEKLFVLV
jgi:uncharacterized membrane protein